MNRIVATMDDLPELPFEKVLSYLSLEDRLKARAVSKRWYNLINSFKVKTFCYSERPRGFIEGKSRWISGAFAQNFISSPRFDLIFNTFGSTIFSNLKHLRICDLRLNGQRTSTFFSTLNMFGRLEELDIIRFTWPSAAYGLGREVELNLPMLTSIWFEEVETIKQLTLDAPKLKKVKLPDSSSSLRLELVHADSVEWLATSRLVHVEVKNLKSLKYLHCRESSEIDATFLSGLEQLKEIHLHNNGRVSSLFEQKQRYGRTDLKVFLCGLLLNGPEDPILRSRGYLEAIFDCLAKNPTRLADEVLLCRELGYNAIERVPPGSEVNVMNRLSDLERIVVDNAPIEDIGRFLDFLTKYPNIVSLEIFNDHPQDLFDQLPEHCAVQDLAIGCPVLDFEFLFRLEHLVCLYVSDGMDLELIRKILEESEFLSMFDFYYRDSEICIQIDHPKRFKVSVDSKKTSVADLNAVIAFIEENTAEE